MLGCNPVASYCQEVAQVLVLFSSCILVYTGSSAEFLYVHSLLLLSIHLGLFASHSGV